MTEGGVAQNYELYFNLGEFRGESQIDSHPVS